MKVISHGNSLRFVCPECNCVFQATCDEKDTKYRGGTYDNIGTSGYYRECPECGCENVKGEANWKVKKQDG